MKGEAQAALTETQKEPEEVWRLFGLTMVYHTLGRKADSDAALAELTRSTPPTGPTTLLTSWRGATSATAPSSGSTRR